jgi:hypothetical protein
VIAVIVIRVDAGGHLGRERARGLPDHIAQLCVTLYKLRDASRDPEKVVPHKHLRVTVRAGSDPDRRYVDARRDLLAELRRNGFEHKREYARLAPGSRPAD